jgi:hypothetical protein
MAFLELKLKDGSHCFLNTNKIYTIEKDSEDPEFWRIVTEGDIDPLICKMVGRGPEVKKFGTLKNILNRGKEEE